MTTYEHKIPSGEASCAYCGHKVTDVMRHTDDDTPEPGHFAKCIRCGEWSVFTEDMSLRKITAAELVAAAEDDEFHIANKAFEHMRRQIN